MRSFSKYSNVRTDGYASKREARRAAELELLEKIGAISELEKQVRYQIIPPQEGETAVAYVCDFRYRNKETGLLVIEDAKGVKTDVYRLKKKLMLQVHGITIKEI